jgi:Carboxypeptidase regulatory-like domain/TonB dependent receptor
MQRNKHLCVCLMLCVLLLGCAAICSAQVNTATLSGTVIDPQGLAIKGAKVTVTNAVTGGQRTAVADESGVYNLVGLTPGRYKMTVDGGPSFAEYQNDSLVVTVGETALLNPRLELRGQQQTVMVNTETTPVETSKTEVSQTIEQRRIDNLPINGRNYINFTLTNSQTTRDVSPTIGPAPNSGLSIGGARARGNMVSVDGADAVDNSVNGIRATVSQEDVQEFQLILSNYNAEYGRATGGVVNIVTKGGGNEFHGDAFGFARNKSFQARNPFSGQVDPATGNLVPVKQAFTRTQSGITFGGPIKKDKTFYFFSYEYTQREESGFSSIGQSSPGTGPFGIDPATGLTPAQEAFFASPAGMAFAAANPQAAAFYEGLLASASNVAIKGIDPGGIITSLSGGSLSPLPGHNEFPLPVSCPSGQTVNSIVCSGGAAIGPNQKVVAAGVVPLPASYVPLGSIEGNFPVHEKTSLWSGRIDQRWDNHNTSFLRVGVSPSLVTGIESTSQNQVFGQNSGSRTGLNQSRDVTGVFQHDTIVSDTAFNEFRFQFARRGSHFGFSQLPGGDRIGVNIPGFAYFGREPYSTVDRIERRFEFTDHVSLVRGKHTFKVGGDFNLIQLRSSKAQIFELDFGGDVNFGGLAASTFGLPDCLVAVAPGATCPAATQVPGLTALQAYGLGLPTTYIQGIGTSNQPFDNIPIGFFAQDSWRLSPKFTVNYGVRYDVELSPLFKPATAINAAAEKALGVVEGIPRNYSDVAPRIGLAWDPRGDGKMVIRAGYGLFYDHPLLAVAFDAVTADGGRSVQLLSPGGTASACGLVTPDCNNGLDSPTNLNGASIFQGALNTTSANAAFAPLTLAYLPNQQRFDPLNPASIFANQNYLNAGFPLPILPFTLPTAKNFKYAYTHQANLTVEREIAGSWKLSVGYQWTRGIHLNRATDINSTDPQLLANNLAFADAAGLGFSNPITVSLPTNAVSPVPNQSCGLTYSAPGLAPGVLGVLVGCPTQFQTLNGKFVGTPAFFNFFRPSGPNPSFAGLLAPFFPPGTPASALYAAQVGLASAAGFPTGFGIPVPFNTVDTQTSNGNSYYHAITVNLTKRFSRNFEALASYTFSHSIDDSADLQSTLEPADSRFPFLERSNSDNDQRHRFVTSAVFQTTPGKSGDGFFKQFIGNFTLSPIIEVSSGRPFNVITGGDDRLDLGASQARPSLGGGTTSPFIHGASFGVASACIANNLQTFTVPGITPPAGCDGTLGRNKFLTPGFFQWDMRVSRRIPLGERFNLDLIADAFNLFNRTNIAAVNQLCDPTAGSICSAGQPTAAYDARQFQFALKLSF